MTTYTRPHVRDYGTLLELTADVDVNFVGFASNLVMAAISGPTGGGGGGEGGSGPGGTVVTPDNTAGGPTGNGGGGTPGGEAGDVGGEDTGGGSGGGGGGSAGGGSAGGGAAGGGGGGGRKLPFTGYPVLLATGVGAALTSAGLTLRSRLRRRGAGSG